MELEQSNQSKQINLHILQIDRHTLGLILIATVSLIWATTFPLLKDALTTLSPSVILAVRSAIAAVALVLCLRNLNGEILRDGALMGLLLFGVYVLQIIGLQSADANRGGFISSLSTIVVPLMATLLGRQVPRVTFFAAGMAITGIGIMCWENGSVSVGDWVLLLESFVYGVYILFVEGASRRHPILTLTAIQLGVIAILSAVWAAPELVGQIEGISKNLGVIIYLGLVGIAAIACLENLGQRWVSASEAALLYTIEPIFTALFSYWFLGEKFGVRGWIGASLVVGALALSQIVGKGSESDGEVQVSVPVAALEASDSLPMDGLVGALDAQPLDVMLTASDSESINNQVRASDS